jgi:lysophospholipase L1-like esterase
MIINKDKLDTAYWTAINPIQGNSFVLNSGELQLSSVGFQDDLNSYYHLTGLTTALKNVGFEIDYRKTSQTSSLWFGLASINANVNISTGILLKNTGDFLHIYVKNFGFLAIEELVGAIPLLVNENVKIGFEIDNELITAYYYESNKKIKLPSKNGTFNTSNFALKVNNGSAAITGFKVFTNYNSSYKFMFHGDSITANGGSYARLMQANFETAINAGQGDYSANLRDNIAFSNSINKEFDIVLIGTNDLGWGYSTKIYEANLILINQALNKNKNGYPLFLDLLPRNSASVDAYRAILYKVIPRNQIIPTHDLIKDFTTGGIQDQYSSDGLHPNALGNKDLKNMLKSYFEKLIN